MLLYPGFTIRGRRVGICNAGQFGTQIFSNKSVAEAGVSNIGQVIMWQHNPGIHAGVMQIKPRRG